MKFHTDALRILLLIGQRGPVSRVEIGKILNFPPSRVTRMTRELFQAEMIHETGKEAIASGRWPELLELREGSHSVGAVLLDHGGLLQTALLDLRGNVLARREFQLGSDATAADCAGKAERGLGQCLAERSDKTGRLLGVGVGAAGLVDSHAGVLARTPAFPEWRDLELSAPLSEAFEVPVSMENDVAMATLGELWYGQGRGSANLLYVHVGPGVRMGIVIKGSLYRGTTNNAGELGHFCTDASGPFCYCGNAGCLETGLSEESVLQDVREALAKRSPSSLWDQCQGEPERLDLAQVRAAAREGDRLAVSVLERYSQPVGQMLGGLTTLFDPGCIVLGGNLAHTGDAVLHFLGDQMQRHSLPVPGRRLELRAASLGTDSALVGGGALVLQSLCEGGGIGKFTAG